MDIQTEPISITRSTITSLLSLVVLGVGASSCEPGDVVGESSELDVRGIRPELVVDGASEAAVGDTISAALILRQGRRADSIGSYQGIIEFDPSALEVASVSGGEGLLSTWNRVEDGRIRLAAATTERIPGNEPVVRFTLVKRSAVTARSVSFQLRELTSTSFDDLGRVVSDDPLPKIERRVR